VAKIEQDDKGNAVVTAEDILGGGKMVEEFDLVVLATGMEPSIKNGKTPVWLNLDENGFVQSSEGVVSTGVAAQPVDVTTSIQNSTGAALRAIQIGAGR
jgi:quinone-modifying oxidoreductase subunit QmoA